MDHPTICSIKPGYKNPILAVTFLAAAAACTPSEIPLTGQKPNVVIIYADDIGYGDLECYGAQAVRTPHVNRLAEEGVRFTHAHACAATCTPSRYGMLTGEYPWRRNDTGVARGDAPMVIRKDQYTVASLMRDAGYATAVIGKWHLGLGEGEFNSQNWNGLITPGPREIGFDYSYIMAATGDRTPCVFIENQQIAHLDPADPVEVSYTHPFEGLPLGSTHPHLLTMHPSHGHDMAIVNGISRIGYMRGGTSALWVDENIADSITAKAVRFLETHQPSSTGKPFFLLFGTHDIHVPRVPHPRFRGMTGMGPRGDAIAQFDWSVGQILETLDRLGLSENTLVILSSDNGPVIDDGYRDQAVELLGDHLPAGPCRGGKYSAFEAGTRVPFIVRWPGKASPGTSGAPISQIDLFATLATLTGVYEETGMTGKSHLVTPPEDHGGNRDTPPSKASPVPPGAAPDSHNALETWLNHSAQGRPFIVEQSTGTLSLLSGPMKYIAPSRAARYNSFTDTELGHDTIPQLYNLTSDPGETTNLASQDTLILRRLQTTLDSLRRMGTPPAP